MARQTGSLLFKIAALGLLLFIGTVVLAPYLDGRVSILYGFVLAPAAMLALLCASVWLVRQPLPGRVAGWEPVTQTYRLIRVGSAARLHQLVGVLTHRHLPLDRST